MLCEHVLSRMLSQQPLGLIENHIQPWPVEPVCSLVPGLRLEVAKPDDCLTFSQPLNTELAASEGEVNIRVV